MNSSVSMTELRSLLLIAEDEIDQSVKSIFEKLKTEMMEHGHRLNKFAPVTTPTHVTNAKYDGAIQYNGAFSYGLPPLYFMSTSSSCISAPLNTSEYAQQSPLSQFAAFSSQAFDCKSHIEDPKLVHKANNEKYEAIIDDAKREIHLLTSTVEEFKTELQNAKADWEQKELQLVDFVKHSEEEGSSLKEEINRLLNLQENIEKEACAMKEEEVQLKDSMKEIKFEVVYFQEALVYVKAENMKLRESILDKKNEFQSVVHENEEFQNREAVYYKKLEELSKLLEEVLSKKQAEENVELTDGEKAYDLLPKVVQFSEDSGHGREEKHKVEFPPTQCAEPQSENLWRWTNVSNGKAKHVDSAHDQIMNNFETQNNQCSVSPWWMSHLMSQLMWYVFLTSIMAVVVHTVMGWCKIGKCGYFGSGFGSGVITM